ncbi:hypothetical protein [Hyalangium rubrum]|uniref:Uncharacterized protein n=1 Tax=Hyalangium rubrum TaxID=3103134 RepID=A0ABU5H257_9BACT|nr:hypothetical protein [Hyalangium sp. s54d21]MDY7226872.1 hypothetical protein [Hyalangium sp. s54d21]
MRRTLLIAAAAFCLGGFATQAYADRQPRMKDALVHLQSALDSLEKAASDKGGHRVKAIQSTKDAIDEVKKGIAFDNKH